ncbi:MAG: dienelactone hydrolase family protein [Bacteroidia bacterium]|nr:dienelactone hydrolase family protein [Bacteroidia bacterium]
MPFTQHYIEISKTARYFSFGNEKDPEIVWFVFHGYGQLAPAFIEKFHLADQNRNLIIAPEGLHRYYRKGVLGSVGASWMTKEDRLNDIKDYVNFLNQLSAKVLSQLEATPKKMNVLGFSQGAATACRWITDYKTCLSSDKVEVDNLVLWAGVFPPDLDMEQCINSLNSITIQLVIGDQDEYIDEQRLKEQESYLKKFNLDYELKRYNGNHDIQPKLFIDYFDQ